MGNDQVRFDLSLRALTDLSIVAPIRELQAETSSVREHEAAYLAKRGVAIEAKTGRYTINENLMGVTISGAEIDHFEAPGPETYVLTAPPGARDSAVRSATVGFEHGAPVRLDGKLVAGPDLLHALDERFGPCGVGRGIYTGDTTIGLKGRIVFECPALVTLLHAHRALEEAVLTRSQNAFKPLAARQWVQLVYEGLFFEPLREDLEAFIRSTQRRVCGEVTVEAPGRWAAGRRAAIALHAQPGRRHVCPVIGLERRGSGWLHQTLRPEHLDRRPDRRRVIRAERAGPGGGRVLGLTHEKAHPRAAGPRALRASRGV